MSFILFLYKNVFSRFLLSGLLIYVYSYGIASAKTYTLAMEITPPFTTLDANNKPQGLSIELISAMLEINGDTLKTTICPFARCLRLIQQGRADFIFGLVKTPERDLYLNYIEPAFITSFTEISFYQLTSSRLNINNMADVEKLNVGIQRGAHHFDEFDNNDLINKIDVVTIADLIEMLKKGRIDTFVMPTLSASQYIEKHSQAEQIKKSNYSVFKEQGGFIAMSKKSPHVDDLSQLSDALSLLKSSGKLRRILEKYNIK